MKLEIEKYNKQVQVWPEKGHHILAQYNEHKIIVYQAYRPEIGKFACKNQYFGGAFKLDRMTWIKPNFLWMMYRNGWGQKPGQEVTLAIHLKIGAFIEYLKQSVYSSFVGSGFSSNEEWKNAVNTSPCRLQWDPDHDPYGNKLHRRAIQIGLRDKLIHQFSKEDILEIEDISGFVHHQFELVKEKKLDELMTPKESPLIFKDDRLNRHLKLNTNK